MARDLPRITARLKALGYAGLLHCLMAGGLDQPMELPFSTLKTAKAVQALFYNWLFFYPEIKARTSLRLDPDTAILSILPRGRTEKRGRGRIT